MAFDLAASFEIAIIVLVFESAHVHVICVDKVFPLIAMTDL
jgi:hypothetical protein